MYVMLLDVTINIVNVILIYLSRGMLLIIPSFSCHLTCMSLLSLPPPLFLLSEQVISHPDEMENLEQYRVIADYSRADNHQVDLTAGQLVHVIEKHDTGNLLNTCEHVTCTPSGENNT